MDKTYIKAKGLWCYYYQAIDNFGATLDFMLSAHRDEKAATRCFSQSIENNEAHEKVVIGKRAANYAGLMNVNTLLFLFGATCIIDIIS